MDSALPTFGLPLGISSFSYPWAIGVPGQPQPACPMNAFDLLNAAIDLGVNRVQYVDNLPLMALSRSEQERLAEQARSAGIGIELGMRGTDETTLREHLELAQRFGSPFVRVVPGADYQGPRDLVSRLRPCLPVFRDAGVLLALENYERMPVQVLRSVVEKLGTDVVRVCLDTTNSWGDLEAPYYVVKTLAPYTCNLHLKDFVIARLPSMLGFIVHGAPTGQGVLDVYDILCQMPPGCTVTHEQWTPFQTEIEETVRLEAKWTAQSIAYLKGFYQ